jgi:hypothetical protein
MEDGLQIDQDRMLAGGDDVLQVEIGRLDGIQQCQVAALALVKALHLLSRPTRTRRDEFHPPIGAAIQDLRRPEGQVGAIGVEPGEQRLKMDRQGHGLGLVHEAQPGAELEDRDRSPISVPVACLTAQSRQRPGIAFRAEQLAQSFPIRAKPLEQFKTARHPLADAGDDLARQDGVLLPEGERVLGLAQPLGEMAEALFRRVAFQEPLESHHVDLERDRAAHHADHLGWQHRKKNFFDRRGIEWNAGVPAHQVRNAGPQPLKALAQ